MSKFNFTFLVRRTLKGGLTAEEWETVASYSDAVWGERMVDKVMLAVSLLSWQPDAICTQCKMTTSVFQINNTIMSPYNIHIS